MRSTIKRVAAIHDLSGFGRCALTVIIPTLSVMGAQVVPLPTALLSTHTGGFTGMYFRDLTEDMTAIARHWKSIGVGFDSIYSGFLGSAAQIDTVGSFISDFAREDTLTLVDPVMGDDGALYSTITPDIVAGMSRLCSRADIITPNLTEACILCGLTYRETETMSANELRPYVSSLISTLRRAGAPRIVVTGIRTSSHEVLSAGSDADGRDFFCAQPMMKKSYPGTGDIFASVLLGHMLRGLDFESAADMASSFTRKTIEYTSRFDTPVREGVALEACLPELFRQTEGVV